MIAMDADIQRIHNMVGELSEAFWERITESGASTFEELYRAQYEGHDPKSEREIAVWSELTSPKNLPALRRYVQYWKDQPFEINRYAARLHEKLLEHAERRLADA